MRVLVLLNAEGRTIAMAGPEGQRDRIAALCLGSGLDATVKLVKGAALESVAREALTTDFASRWDAIVVGGGDGSVSTLAALLVGSKIPLGILPLGTLNHFAKDLGIPLDIEAALAVIAAGHIRTVDVADVNGRYFVNNSSIGLYAHMLSDRIRQQRHFGRSKWIALGLAALRILNRFPLYRLTISSAQGVRPRKTPFAFIGNNMYALDPLSIGERVALDQGELCVYIANSQRRIDFLALSLQIALGRPDQARGFELLKFKEVEIHSRRRRLRVARDGELEIMHPPLRYRIHPKALRVFAPSPAP